MSEVVIYHNPRCSKSREALSIIKSRGIEPTVIRYLKESIPVEELEEILEKLGLEPEELVRKNESIYRDNFQRKEFTRDEWVRILHNYPRLMQRPIVVNGSQAVVGRSPEKVNELLDALLEEE